MAIVERVTVTLPDHLVRDIDRRRRGELRRSLQHPHPESAELAEQDFEEWARGLPEEDTDGLVDGSSGTPVRWVPGEGWVEG
jgi:hypothetical protein